MSLRTAALRLVDVGRSLLGPDVTDMRPTVAQIIVRTWTGGDVGRHDPIDDPVESITLPLYSKVRAVTQREIAGSGGRFEDGDVVLGPITPQYPMPDGTVAGFTEIQLRPKAAQGTEIVYKFEQQEGHATGLVGEYVLIEFKRDKALRFELVLGRARTTS